MPFENNNTTYGIPPASKFQVGVSDVDSSSIGSIEKGFLLPYPSEPALSWVYYDCTVMAMLDSGIAIHNRLPQINNTPDTLASCDYADPKFADLSANGVNLKCKDQYTDIVQRMGHSRYWFRLYGQALRIGFQVPIPSIKTIGGVPAIPYDKNPQWAFNRIAPGGNYGGIILWHAAWSLWYTTAVPPRSDEIPAVEPSVQIDGSTPLPKGIQTPYSQPDDDAVKAAPRVNNAGFGAGGNNARLIP